MVEKLSAVLDGILCILVLFLSPSSCSTSVFLFFYFLRSSENVEERFARKLLDSPYIFPSSDRMILRRPHGGYIVSASWKLCSISGDHTPSASAADRSFSSCKIRTPRIEFLTDSLANTETLVKCMRSSKIFG